MKPKKKKAVRRPKAVAAEKVEKPKVKKKMGRPSTLTESVIKRVLALVLQGKTEMEIAKAINVSIWTLMTWKKGRDDFEQALKAAREVADASVVRSLRERALGYKCPAIKIHFSKFGKVSTHSYTEHYPPDTTACIFWLKNRQKEQWRDVQRLEHSGEVNGNVQVVVTLPSNGREVVAS